MKIERLVKAGIHVSELKIGETGIVVGGGSGHLNEIVLRCYEVLVSLNSPGRTWTMVSADHPDIQVCRANFKLVEENRDA